jgi:hypothetical protein
LTTAQATPSQSATCRTDHQTVALEARDRASEVVRQSRSEARGAAHCVCARDACPASAKMGHAGTTRKAGAVDAG